MRILFLGDIVGRVGRDAVHLSLNALREKYHIDFVIANAENASHGRGLTKEHYHFLADTCGIDAITLGNHWYDKKEIEFYFDEAPELIRPLNIPDCSFGVGTREFLCHNVPIRVTNILGTGLMKDEVSSPYTSFSMSLLNEKPSIHIVDYHAECTSEKITFAYFFDGKATAFLGTHTHVQTNDARILEKGSAFMSDVGMCGNPTGIIGFEKQSVINKVVYGARKPFGLKEDGKKMMNGLLLDVSEETYRATSLETINFVMEETYEENVDSRNAK